MEFATMTPHETGLVVTGRRKRDLSIAWHSAVLVKMSEIPPLADLLGDTPPAKPQTAGQMIEIVRHLNAAFGGTEVPAGTEVDAAAAADLPR